MESSDVFILGMVGLLGFCCQWLAWRVKLPAILFFLLVGLLLGPVSGVLNPDDLFGELLFPFISLSVAVILFEGSLTLKHIELRKIGSTVRNLVTYGALINAVITTVATHYLIGLDWSLAALFGVIMVVTGPTVIMPMLRTVKPNGHIATALRWEGIVIDPLGAILAVLVFEFMLAQQTSSDWTSIMLIFSKTIITGVIAGASFGYLLGLLLRHNLIPEYLHNFATIAFVASAFGISEALMHESGLLTVTIMGVWLANMRNVYTRDILNFKESLTVMLVSVLFIVLSARIDFEAMATLGWGALGVFLAVQFLSRPVKVFLSCVGSDFSFKERALMAWVGPRGIVAAAVSAVFAIKLDAFDYPNADLLVPLAFSVIMGTVILQSATAKSLARWLQVRESGSGGYVIIGANPVAREIAKALKDVGMKSLLCDQDWSNISSARMQGLDTYYGNPISDHADIHMNIGSYHGMLGMSPQNADNTAASLRFREDFGTGNIFVLAASEDKTANEKHRTSRFYRGRVLFGADINYPKVRLALAAGAKIKGTLLSESYDFNRWLSDPNNEQSIPFFAVDQRERLHWFTDEGTLKPEPGWRIFALSPQKGETEQ